MNVADTEVQTSASAPAAAPEAAQAAVSAPVETAAPAPATVETPSTEAPVAPATSETPAEATAEPVVESFLGEPKETTEEAPKAEEPKVDAPKTEEPKTETATEPATTETPANDGVLEPFETFKGIDGQEATPEFMGKFTPVLAELQNAKTKEDRQAAAQKIVDLGAEAVKNAAQQVNDFYKNAYETRQKEWREQLLKDPDLGRGDEKFLKQSAQSMANFLAAKGGTKEEIAAFRKTVSEAGIENSPAIVRVLNNLKSRLEKYENESSRMLPGTKPAVSAPANPGKGMINRLYGGAR